MSHSGAVRLRMTPESTSLLRTMLTNDVLTLHLETARSWTGRSVTSFATDSAITRLVASGTFRTRVSEMRVAAPGKRACSTQRGMSGRRTRG